MNAKRFDQRDVEDEDGGGQRQSPRHLGELRWREGPREPQCYDLVLVAVGRSPNGKKIGAEKAGVAVTERGFIEVDKQMRTNVAHIFAIGDIVGQPMLAHKAVHEAHVAAEVAAGEKSYFDARQIPSVAYTDPEVGVGRQDRGAVQGRRHQVRQGCVPLGGDRAARSRTAATRVSRS